MSQGSEPEGLSANAAGAIQDLCRVRHAVSGEDGVECLGLTLDGFVPVLEDEVVGAGQRLVEREDFFTYGLHGRSLLSEAGSVKNGK